MNFLSKINPEWPLRLGLGIMYLYSGYDLMLNPSAWIWAVPWWFSKIVTFLMPLDSYLRLQGAGEFIMGVLFLAPLELILTGRAWFSIRHVLRVVSILAVIELVGILIFTGIGPITFRDIGLLGGAIALLVMTFSTQREISGKVE
ncbi:MAG: hypothetical protein HYT98_02765 [Candidatus Sungbacteria bacterium]|nr:hypothetical protein [Candidatus Sungbacteria bacterium]